MRLFGTPLDRADGTLGLKRLAAIAAVLLVVGGLGIFLARNYLVYNRTYKATTIEASAKGHVGLFRFDSGGTVIGKYPPKMTVKKGDRVRLRVDELQGVVVVKILDE